MDGQDWTPVIVGKKSYASALGSSGSRVVPAPAQVKRSNDVFHLAKVEAAEAPV